MPSCRFTKEDLPKGHHQPPASIFSMTINRFFDQRLNRWDRYHAPDDENQNDQGQ
jgi:hypothetical protein